MTNLDRVIGVVCILAIGLGLFLLLATDTPTWIASAGIFPASLLLMRLYTKLDMVEQLAKQYEQGEIDGYYNGFHSRDRCKHDNLVEHCLLCGKSSHPPDPYHYYKIKDSDDPRIKKQFGDPNLAEELNELKAAAGDILISFNAEKECRIPHHQVERLFRAVYGKDAKTPWEEP